MLADEQKKGITNILEPVIKNTRNDIHRKIIMDI